MKLGGKPGGDKSARGKPACGKPGRDMSGRDAIDGRTPARDRPNRALWITLLVSLGLHLAAAIAALLLLHGGVQIADEPEKLAEVELVMEEHKGDTAPAATPPAAPVAAPAKKTPSEDQKPPSETAKAAPPPAQPSVEALSDTSKETDAPAIASSPASAPQPPVQQPVPETASASSTKETPPPPTPPPQEARPEQKPAPATATVTLNLHGTDSPSDATAWGDRILPASPDAVFHNRPPEYPDEAVRNGEHGTVVVLIHVSPSGRTAGVDVIRSSGYVVLDRAASEAVARWRFLPAIKNGQPVASDMTMGFVFDF
jgi:protein TonB